MSDLHVVLGASSLGRAVVVAALSRGARVRVVSRSGRFAAAPDGVEVVAADVSDPEAATAAARGAAVIYHCAAPAYTEWAQQHPALMRGVLAAGAATGAVVVNASNAYMYDLSDVPTTEHSAERPRSRKGRIRADLDAEVRRAHDRGEVRAVTVRAPDYYGPWGSATTVYGDRVFGRLLAGRRPQVFGDLDVPHTWICVDDFGRALVDAAVDETAWGSTRHVSPPPPLTQRELLALIGEIAGVDVRPQAAPTAMVKLAGLASPVMRELGEMAYQWEQPYVFAAAQPLGDGSFTPHREAIARTVDWFRAQHSDGPSRP
jgi:nucleoside-diphosphate-sugar epimerase